MTERHNVLNQAVRSFVGRMAHEYRVGDVLDELAGQVGPVLGATAGGVTLMEPKGTTSYVAASDARAARTEALEAELNQGPCVACISDCSLQVVPDLLREWRWPAYVEAVRPLGWRTVLGVPLMVGDRCIGGLDVYGDEPREWESEELGDAQLLADMAASYIVNARALEETRTLAEQLQRALDSRIVIEQAKGVMVAKLGVEPDRAFELLRRQARSSNQTIHEVCRQVLDGALPATPQS